MKKRLIKLIYLVVPVLILGLLQTSALGQHTLPNKFQFFNNGVFEYPLSTDDNNWESLGTVDEMIQTCRIPTDFLSSLSTEELVNATLEYPLLINLYLYDTYEHGLEALKNESDAFVALLSRSDSGEKLLAKYNTIPENNLNKKTISILITEPQILKTLSQQQLSRIANSNKSRAAFSTSTVKTSKGSNVAVEIRGEELTSVQKTQINNEIKTAYPQAVFESSSTTNYNCHSYAWYSTSTSNIYWMDDPSLYMSDGSYYQVFGSTTYKITDRIFYDSSSMSYWHSAMVLRAENYPNIKDAYVVSKWGKGPVMKHAACYSPYPSYNLSLWRKS